MRPKPEINNSNLVYLDEHVSGKNNYKRRLTRRERMERAEKRVDERMKRIDPYLTYCSNKAAEALYWGVIGYYAGRAISSLCEGVSRGYKRK